MSVFDDYQPDPFEDAEDVPVVECRHCGKGGLHWEDDNGTWKLYTVKYMLHVCKTEDAQKGVANDFDVVKP